MLHLLRRHPIAVAAVLRRSLVVTYAFPAELLQSLLPPGLAADRFGELGFLAIALVETSALRPAFLPAAFGHDFFLSGYRIFTRFGSRRGLYILRSDTSSERLAGWGNLLTRYRYEACQAAVSEEGGELRIVVRTPRGNADLDVAARIGGAPAPLPPGSPFPDAAQARRFAGPLPYTFDYEPETHSMIAVHGVRREWNPQPVAVEVRRNSFLDSAPFCQARPVLANAFYLHDVPYRWMRGERTELENLDVEYPAI